MIKVDDKFIEQIRQLSIQDPDNYLEEYIFLTYDCAFMKGEQGDYKKMTYLLKECMYGLIDLKKMFIIEDIKEIIEMAFGIHDLMIELVEAGLYDLADEIHDLLGEMLDFYEIKLKRSTV